VSTLIRAKAINAMNAANEIPRKRFISFSETSYLVRDCTYFAVNTHIRPGTATGAEKPKTKLTIGFSSEQPVAPPACLAGWPILPVIMFEQKLAVKIRLSSNLGGLGGF
jgi:hypothetical protein